MIFDELSLSLCFQGRYVRMDRFQEDMFNVFERARRLSRTDSQVRLHVIYIKTEFGINTSNLKKKNFNGSHFVV
jgi:L-rhamnose isomerase